MCQDASGDPVVFNVSPTAYASDVIYMQGSGFGATPHVQYSYNDSNWANLPVVTSGSNTAMVQLPAPQTRLPDLLTLRISADGSRWSSSVFVNQANALSFDTSQIASGNHFRIFGRNLHFSRTPTVRLEDNTTGSSSYASVNIANSSSYALSAIAPNGIQTGHTYSVYVSNGYNGNAEAGSETLAAAKLQGRAAGNDYWNLGLPWAADLNYTGNVYNIQNDPRLQTHANGSGSASDANAIQNAIYTASNAGGGIVYLPAGTYNLNYSGGCGLTLMPRVAIMGAGTGNTFVNYGFGTAPTLAQGGWAVCLVNSKTGLSDITFTNVNQSGHWPQSLQGLNASEVFVQRTVWNISTAQWVTLQNINQLTFQHSTINQGLDPSYNGPLCLLGSSNVTVRNNNIKYVAGALTFDGVSNGVIENNSVVRDASQTAPTGVITHVAVASFTKDLMLLNNTFSVTGGTLPTRNDGETISSEAGGDVRRDEFRGTVTGWSTNSITDNNQNFNWSSNNAIPNLHVGAIVAIVGGKGAGQWSTINYVTSDGHTVYVNKPWLVQPQAGSTYATFDWSAANWIIADNALSDNEKGIEFFNSSIRDILITGNRLTNNGEILISPTEQPNGSGLFNLVLNTQVTNNTLVDTNKLRPAAISAVSREDGQNTNFGTAIIGFEARGNSITGATPNTVLAAGWLDDSKALTEGFNLYWQWQTLWSNFIDNGTPSIVGSIFQDNTLNDSAAAIHMNSGVSQTVFADDDLNHVTSTQVDLTLPGATHASLGTVHLATPAITNGTPAPPNVWKQLTVGSLPAASLKPQPATAKSFTLSPSLYQIGTGSDSFSMLARQMSNDMAIIAKVGVPTSASAGTEAQIVFRTNANPLSGFVSLGQLQNGSIIFQYRVWQGAGVGGYTFSHSQSPVWLRLTKSGNDYEGQFSDDGVNWQNGGLIGALLGDTNFDVGLEYLSDTLSGPAVTFSNVSLP